MISSLGSDKGNGRAHHILEHPMMDESTQQLLDALEQRFRLQLKPIETRQQEMFDELKSWRGQMQTLETNAALSQSRIERCETDLNRALKHIRKDFAERMEDLDDKIKDKNRLLVPLFTALATVTTILLVLLGKWMMS